MPREKETGFEKPTRPRRRIGLRKGIAIGLLVLMAVVFFGVPYALQSRSLVVSLANRYAGIAPIRIDIERIDAGWFRPFRVQGLKLIDGQGAELIKVAELDTELSLFNLALNYRNLKTITVKGAEVQLDVQPETTNLEQALKPLMASVDNSDGTESSTKSSTSGEFVGRIRIQDAIVHARDSVDLTSWDLVVSQADIPLPTASQPIPPMTAVGMIRQIAALPGEVLVGGQFNITTQPLGQLLNNVPIVDKPNSLSPMNMTISTNGLPLQWFSLIKRRMPDIPVERIMGLASVQASVELYNNRNAMAKIQTAQIDSLQVVAPELVGPRGAAIRQIRLTGNVHFQDERLKTEGLNLICDVGRVAAQLDMPIAPNIPSLGQPWIQNAQYEITGEVDIAQLILVAPDLIQMQEQVQLVSGKAVLRAEQKSSPTDPGSFPSSNYQLSLGGLQANMSGTMMKWDQALQAKMEIAPLTGGQPSFKAECLAEFCEITGSGDLQRGQLKGSFDLAKMQNRLAQWFALPIETMTGSANCHLSWGQDEGNRFIAKGALTTTPLSITTAKGRLNEPAWAGDVSFVGRMDKGSLIQVDRASVLLKADGANELLSAAINEPISLMTSTPGMAQLPPASMELKLIGDIGGWQRRGQLLSGFDAGVFLGGRCELVATGAVDKVHAEITNAKFNAREFFVQSGGTKYYEPEIDGLFQGRADTQDIAKLQVDQLLVRAQSFAVQAKDEAVPGQSIARRGNAAYRINPTSLMAAIQSDPPTPNTITVQGDVTGQMGWQIDSNQIAWAISSDMNQIKVLQLNAPKPTTQLISMSTAPKQVAPTTLWEEPQAKSQIDGKYSISTGKLEISAAQIQTEWFAYSGAANLVSSADTTSLVSKGNVTYDAAIVAHRLKPFIGNYLDITGVKQQPLDVSWTSNSKNSSWADSLQAQSNIGWDSANVIGIPIGVGEVPLRIENGHLLTKSEIPVSQGKLRWNLDGDLAAPTLTIVQSPDTVIDNVAITPLMCQGWLKFVAPLLAEVTSVQGNLSLKLDEAVITPLDLTKQTIKGRLTVHGAQVGPGPLADQLLQLVQQVRNLRKGLGATDGGGQSTSWLHMPQQEVSFNVQQGRVTHQNMQIQAGDIVISTSGSVGVDGSLELIASVPVLKEWIDKAPALQSLAGQAITLPLRGTVQKPVIDYSSFTGLAQQIGSAALRNEAQKQIDKGLNKLLGPISNQLGPIQQGMQQMQQGVQQNLPQLPLPNLQNLQLPGFGNAGPFGGASGTAPAVPPQN